jgi:hypothetical protein
LLAYPEEQNTPAIVADDQEAVEHSEGDCRNREELHREQGPPGDYEERQASAWVKALMFSEMAD